MTTETLPPAPSPEHLTEVLGRAGALGARLGTTVGVYLDTGPLDTFQREFPGQLARFVDRLGDRFSAERRQLYERLIVAVPRLLERYATHRDLTIVNGDAHVWNALYPREPASTEVRLIDWSHWRIDVATDDLAYMMAIHWYPERRRRLERALLDRYHAALVTGCPCCGSSRRRYGRPTTTCRR
jgi:hypothetical protein